MSEVQLYNIEIEKCVLGTLIVHPEVYYDVQEQLWAESFYRQQHRLIYEAIMAMHQEQEPIDLPAVTEKLRKMGDLDKVGGLLAITGLVEVAPFPGMMPSYVKTIVDYAQRRALLVVAEKIKHEASDVSAEIDIAGMQGDLLRAAAQSEVAGLVQMQKAMLDFSAWMDERAEHEYNGVLTGIAPLDLKLKGMESGNLIVIAARPSMGKTALVGQVASYASAHGKKVLFFSMEMTRNDILARIVAARAEVDAEKIRTPKNLSENDWGKVLQAQQDISQWQLVIDDERARTPMQILSRARQMQGQIGLDLIVIDYLQLMTDGLKHSGDNRVQEIANISRALKSIAGQLGVPVVVLSQLSRAVESRNDKRPQLSDLRDSGSIEQDADVVMMLYREKYYYPEVGGPDITEIAIKKFRNGKTGTVKIMFLPQMTKFVSMAQDGFETMGTLSDKDIPL